MPTAGKIFVATEGLPLSELSVVLEGYRNVNEYNEGDFELDLITEIANINITDDILTGLYSYDYVIHHYHRGNVKPSPATKEVLFAFNDYEGFLYLIVIDKKDVANRVANNLSKIIYGEIGVIIESRIQPETFKKFHLENPESTRVIFFENMDIPNLNKLSLYGSDVVDTRLFKEYDAIGDPWYILTKSKKHAHTVGLVRDGSCTIFNTIDKGQYINYAKEEIIPMTQPPRPRNR